MAAHYTLARSPSGIMTLQDQESGEWLHRYFGPLKESESVYVQGCRVTERSGVIRICDLGLGGGFNALASIKTALLHDAITKIEITSFDKTLQGLQLVARSLDSFPDFHLFELILDQLIQKKYVRTTDQNFPIGNHHQSGMGDQHRRKNPLEIEWTILLGDAFQEILTLPPETRFDCVFYDLFSPASSPKLWTRDAFALFTSRLLENGVLATYSMATSIRAALLSLNLFVGDGPLVAPNMPSTLASPSSTILTNLLTPNWRSRFTRSGKPFSSEESEMSKVRIEEALASHPQWQLPQWANFSS